MIHLYADDTILYTVGPVLDTVLNNLQESFNNIQHSFCSLQLLLNSSKTKVMLFDRSHTVLDCSKSIITLDGFAIEWVDTYKYLGVWLDSSLSFQTHINQLQAKIKSRIGFLFRNKASFTFPAKLAFVKMTILPIIDFGDIIYRIASNSLLRKLDVVYHSVIRFVTNAPYNTHHCNLYSLIGWPSLHTRRQKHWYLFIYKCLLCKTPPYLQALISRAIPTMNLRSSRYITLVATKARTSFGRLSFQFSAANDWNTLQKSLKLESTVPLITFKSLLANLLSDHCTC